MATDSLIRIPALRGRSDGAMLRIGFKDGSAAHHLRWQESPEGWDPVSGETGEQAWQERGEDAVELNLSSSQKLPHLVGRSL